jgi:hypothetical protein
MSFKLLQFSPQPSTRIRMRNVPDRWTEGYEYARGVTFLPSWMEDSEPSWDAETRRVNWGAISGLVLSLAIGGGFWVGLGLLVARAVR